MNNIQRKNAVVKEIFKSMIFLLKEKEFNQISISEITQTAQVSRNSFYRNFSSKEDIIKKYIALLLSNWQNEFELNKNDSNADLFGNLFHHLKVNQEFYVMLKRQNLFYLFHLTYLELYGPQKEDSNIEAYVKRFIAGGVINWINRGMIESAESMSTLLKNHGMQ